MDYAGNSKKEEPKENVTEKITEKKVEKVVTGKVIQRQKPLGKRMKEIFLGGEARTVGEYLARDVLAPALRNLIYDTIAKGAERMVYGEDRYPRSRPQQTDYRSRFVYDARPRRDYIDTTGRPAHLPDQPRRPRPARGGFEFILTSKQDAEAVIERLDFLIGKYDVASLADLKDILGHESEYTDNKWGWTALRDIEIRQIREGYLLDLPPAEEI